MVPITKNFANLVADLQTAPIFNQMGPGFAMITPGNWAGVITWAADFGYGIALTDIETYITQNPKIFMAIASQPGYSGWTIASLQAAIAA